MIPKPCALKIARLFNWMDYENRVWVVAESDGVTLCNRMIEGRVMDNYLKLMLEVQCENSEKVRRDVCRSKWGSVCKEGRF